MQIQISWPTDLDLHSLQRQGISGFRRTRVKKTGPEHGFCTSGQNFKNIESQDNVCMQSNITLHCILPPLATGKYCSNMDFILWDITGNAVSHDPKFALDILPY